MSDMYMLNNVGDRTDPWGTPALMFVYLDVWLLYVVYIWRSLSSWLRICYGCGYLGVLYFVDELMNVDHFKGFVMLSAARIIFWMVFVIMVLLIWCSAVVVQCAALKPC